MSSSVSTGLKQPPTSLSASSNSTPVLNSLPTGVSLEVEYSLFDVVKPKLTQFADQDCRSFVVQSVILVLSGAPIIPLPNQTTPSQTLPLSVNAAPTLPGLLSYSELTALCIKKKSL